MFFLLKPFHELAHALKVIGQAMKAVFNPHRVEEVLKIIAEHVALALPIVETIALMTPDRTDDQILAAAKSFMFGDFSLSMFADRTDALRAIARFALSAKIRMEVVHDATVLKDSILNAAIDQAYAIYRNGQEVA